MPQSSFETQKAMFSVQVILFLLNIDSIQWKFARNISQSGKMDLL